MMKRVWSVVLALALCVSLLPLPARAAVVASGYCGGEGDGKNLSWTLDDQGTLTISGTGAMTNYSSYDMLSRKRPPWYSYDVTAVVVEDGVTRIGWCAFSTYAWYGTTLKSVTIADSVTSIGESAFSGCSCGFTSFRVPNGVTSFEGSVFGKCDSLVEFVVDSDHPAFCTRDGVLYSKDGTELVMWPEGKTPCVIPNGVKSISPHAFDGCNLKSVTAPTSLESIGEYAFAHCSDLESVNLALSEVKTIDHAAFTSCGRLQRISFPSSLAELGSAAFMDCFKLECIDGLSSCKIPSIKWRTFYNCIKLVYISLPQSVTYIGEEAFYRCEGLQKVTFPNVLETIGEKAFWECGLKNLTIPRSVASIKNSAFFQCSELADVYYPGTQAQWQVIAIGTGNESLKNATIHYSGTEVHGEYTGLKDGTDPDVSRLYIEQFTPNHTAVDKDMVTLSFTFNLPVEQRSGSISICGQKNGEITKIALPSPDVMIDGCTVTLGRSFLDRLKNHYSYYILIENGSFASLDGTVFHGISEREQWEFTVAHFSDDDVNLKWEKSFLHADHSKPPIPAMSDDECADLLCKWAVESGVHLEKSQAKAMLNEPVEFPVTDMNGSTILLNDRATTVRQVINDLIFTEYLQYYVWGLNDDLGEIHSSGTHYDQERAIYQKAMSWYAQINRYMKSRNGESNFFYSVAAPAAYKSLLKAAGAVGGEFAYYSYISPILSASLASYEDELSVRNLQNYANYADFKRGVETIKTAQKVNSTLKKCYVAYAEGKVGGVVTLSANLMLNFFGSTNNKVLQDISESWSTVEAVASAAKVAVMMGSSLGLFPLLMDFANKAYTKLEDTTKAFYFIGDYYIYEKYPEIYDAIYDDETCFPVKDNLGEIVSGPLGAQISASNDPVLSNWWNLLTETGVIENEESRCREMRLDLVNYIMLLKYVGEAGISEQKGALVRLISAKMHKGATTGISVSCPVEVAVYDAQDNLLATLSSKDNTIQQCEYGTLYLMGENNETKYFLLNSDAYHVIITPYEDASMENSMDVLIVNNAADGTSTHSYYEDVSLNNVAAISTYTSGDNSDVLQITGTDSQSLEVGTTAVVPVSSVQIKAPQRIPVGGSAVAIATIYPAVATNHTLTWSSSDQSVVTVDSDGTLHALAIGSSTITVTAANGASDSFVVTTYVPASSIQTDIQQITMVEGETYLLSTLIEPAGAEASWTSSDASIAIVDENGMIQALSAGQTILTISSGDISAEVAVTVSKDMLRVSAYQSDVRGSQIRLSMQNCSCTTDFDGIVCVAIYQGDGKMVFADTCAESLSAGASKVFLLPVSIPNGTMEAKIIVLDKNFSPIQEAKETIVIG